MLILALDTSTHQASIALCSEDVLYGEYIWRVNNNHSVEMLQEIQHLLKNCDLTLAHVDAIAVATGPGSFNGVRVALATAKTLAYILKKPLVGISTLECMAFQQRQWRGLVCAVQEAGRSELYAACYAFDEQRNEQGEVVYAMHQCSDYLLLPPQEIAGVVQEKVSVWTEVAQERQALPALFAGELISLSRQRLRESLQAQCVFEEQNQTARRASALALIALQRLREGKEDDPLLLEPLYLRRPSITTSTRKQALLGGVEQRQVTEQNKPEREEGALRH